MSKGMCSFRVEGLWFRVLGFRECARENMAANRCSMQFMLEDQHECAVSSTAITVLCSVPEVRF